MLSHAEIAEAVADRLDQLLPEARAADIVRSTDLRTVVGFDSLAFMELLVWLETAFQAVVPDEQLLPETLNSVEKITDYVLSSRTATP